MSPTSPTSPSERRPEDTDRSVEKLFLRHIGSIKSYIHALIRDRGMVDDVVQETFLVVSAKADTFRPGTNFLAWACTIARFEMLEAIRRSAREHQFLCDEAIDALATEIPVVEDRETRMRHLDTCLESLSQSLRKVLDLRYFQECSPPEIARSLSLTVESTYVALSRARRSLRGCLEGKLKRSS